MKKLTLVLSTVLFMFLFACGGSPEQKDDAKQEETKKETKKLSQSTKEGMMEVLNAADIKVPDVLKYDTVEKRSDSYYIHFITEDVDDETTTKLDEWYVNQIQELENAGWKKVVVRDNEKMFGAVFNEIIMYPPKDKNIDVSYGISLNTASDPEKKTFKFSVSAN
ncbi:MAG: hypothetical protein ACLFVR_10635 [Thiohalospira sp.]